LREVLMVVLCGTIAGAEDFVEIRRRGLLHPDFLRRCLPFAHGIPSHDTLNDIINAIDGASFDLLRHHNRSAVSAAGDGQTFFLGPGTADGE
jgi:hypothetical protein